MGTQAELAVELTTLKAGVTAIGVGITALNTTVAALEEALANAGTVTPEVQAAVDGLKSEVAATAALLPQTPVVEDPPLLPVTEP